MSVLDLCAESLHVNEVLDGVLVIWMAVSWSPSREWPSVAVFLERDRLVAPARLADKPNALLVLGVEHKRVDDGHQLPKLSFDKVHINLLVWRRGFHVLIFGFELLLWRDVSSNSS